MKRIYKNNDIIFNITQNHFPINPELCDDIQFKFFTLNKSNYVTKDKSNLVGSRLTLEWSEISKLEQGVLYYSFEIITDNPDLQDLKQNTVKQYMTDYFLMTGVTGIDVPGEAVHWGEIKGDIKDQSDLVDMINQSKVDLTPINEHLNTIDSTLETIPNTYATKDELTPLASKSELESYAKTEALTPINQSIQTNTSDIATIKSTYATKDELTPLASKSELESYAKTEALTPINQSIETLNSSVEAIPTTYATKDELTPLATKVELEPLATKVELEPINTELESLRADVGVLSSGLDEINGETV